MTLKELMELRTKKLERMKALNDGAEKENRDLNEAESAEYATLKGEADGLSNRMTRAREQEELSRSTGVLVGNEDQAAGREARGRVEMGADLEAERPFRDFGEQLLSIRQAVLNPADIDKRLLAVATKERRAALGMNTMTDSEGGFLVQQDFAGVILETAVKAGQLTSRVDTYQIGATANGAKWIEVDETDISTTVYGGVIVYWRDEAGAVTAKKPVLKPRSLELKGLMGLAYATEEMLEDSTFAGALLQRAFMTAIQRQLDGVIVNGDGANKPLGILNGGSLITIAKETGQAASTINFKNIVKMWNRLHAEQQQQAVWVVHPDVLTTLMFMEFPVGTGGVPVFLPPGGASVAPYNTLFGRPVLAIDHCSALGSAGDIILMVPNEYLMITKGGLKVDTSIHVAFLTAEQAFRFRYRVNGAPKKNTALTIKNSSDTRSSFVTLAARA